jgi:hypothetical protein
MLIKIGGVSFRVCAAGHGGGYALAFQLLLSGFAAGHFLAGHAVPEVSSLETQPITCRTWVRRA